MARPGGCPNVQAVGMQQQWRGGSLSCRRVRHLEGENRLAVRVVKTAAEDGEGRVQLPSRSIKEVVLLLVIGLPARG